MKKVITTKINISPLSEKEKIDRYNKKMAKYQKNLAKRDGITKADDFNKFSDGIPLSKYINEFMYFKWARKYYGPDKIIQSTGERKYRWIFYFDWTEEALAIKDHIEKMRNLRKREKLANKTFWIVKENIPAGLSKLPQDATYSAKRTSRKALKEKFATGLKKASKDLSTIPFSVKHNRMVDKCYAKANNILKQQTEKAVHNHIISKMMNLDRWRKNKNLNRVIPYTLSA